MKRKSFQSSPLHALILSLLSLALFGLSTSKEARAQADWPAYLRDNARTGHNSEESTVAPPLSLSWSTASLGLSFSDPIVVGDSAYAYCSDPGVMLPPPPHAICAVGLSDGSLLWKALRADLMGGDEVFPSQIAEANGVLYLTTNLNNDRPSGYLYALSAADGSLLWKKAFASRIEGANPIVEQGIIFLQDMRGKVYAIDAGTQAVRWTFNPGTLWRHDEPIAVNETLLYHVNKLTGQAGQPAFHGLEILTGVEYWTGPVPSGHVFYPRTLVGNTSNNLAYYVTDVSTNVFQLHAIVADYGTELWTFQCSGRGAVKPVLGTGRLYYYCPDASNPSDASLFVLDASSGTQLAHLQIPTPSTQVQHLTMANGVLYASGVDPAVGQQSHLRAFDAATGALLWESPQADDGFGPVVIANGRVLATAYGPQEARLHAWTKAAAGPLPDLQAGVVELPADPVVGVPTTATVLLSNAGPADAGGFRVRWLLDGVEISSSRLASLAQGATASLSSDWTPAAGTHTLRFEADADDEVIESDEGNNATEVTVDVAGPPARLIDVSLSTSALTVSAEGWYENNPVEIQITPSCPATNPLRCQGDLELRVEAGAGVPRFFVYDAAVATPPSCIVTVDNPEGHYSSRAYTFQCPFELFPGQSATYPVRMWVQPSDPATHRSPLEAARSCNSFSTASSGPRWWRSDTVSLPSN